MGVPVLNFNKSSHTFRDFKYDHVHKPYWIKILPRHIPEPPTGIFETQLRGGSQVPEKSPGPPHASPNVRAQTRQHLS